MTRKKKAPKRKTTKDQSAIPIVPPMGPPTNLRAGGPMEDRRLRRRLTRAAEEGAAIDEGDDANTNGN
jgi:hypothetical protein